MPLTLGLLASGSQPFSCCFLSLLLLAWIFPTPAVSLYGLLGLDGLVDVEDGRDDKWTLWLLLLPPPPPVGELLLLLLLSCCCCWSGLLLLCTLLAVLTVAPEGIAATGEMFRLLEQLLFSEDSGAVVVEEGVTNKSCRHFFTRFLARLARYWFGAFRRSSFTCFPNRVA